MPARYYTQRFEVGVRSNGKMKHATFVFLDTSPCISDYRSDDPAGYVPPPEKAPEFHANIMTQDCDAQYEWLKGVMEELETTYEWVIVVGHHPIHEADVNDFAGLLEDSVMSLYLTGHRHKMQAYTYDGHPHQTHILSGGGCMIDASAESSLLGTSVFSYDETIAGFTKHTFINDLTQVETEFFDVNGKVLYSVVTDNKNLDH